MQKITGVALRFGRSEATGLVRALRHGSPLSLRVRSGVCVSMHTLTRARTTYVPQRT